MEEAFDGIKVVEFAWAWIGPLIGKYIADHGGMVVTIESRTQPDICRTVPPYKDNIPGFDRTGPWTEVHSDRYSMTLNLRHPKKMEVVEKLIKWGDIVTENFTPGIMQKLGLGYEELRKINPEIIMLSSGMQGQTGPHALHPGMGMLIASLLGYNGLTGWPDRLPSGTWGALADHISPRFGAAALIAALIYRKRTGRGQHLDLSTFESTLQFLSVPILDYLVNGRVASRTGNRHPFAAPHGVYPCKGKDRWCSIGILTEKEWNDFRTFLGQSETWVRDKKFSTVFDRKEHEDELDKLVASWSLKYTAEQVMSLLQAVNISCGVVYNGYDLLHCPQFASRKFFCSLKHSEIGDQIYDNPPFKLSRTPTQLKRAAPLLGEHTEYVSTQLLGISDEEFVTLLTEGVFE